MARYIDADKMREEWLEEWFEHEYVYDANSVLDSIDEQPTADVVNVIAFDLVKWERDMAIEQLKSYGVELCENKELVEVVRCKDCKHRCSDKCPMYHEELQDYDDYGYKSVDVVATDNTIDDGFCDKGERIDLDD